MMRSPNHEWTEEQLNFVRERYKEVTAKQVLKEVNEKFGLQLTEGHMKSCLTRYRIRSGRTGHFPKGNIPYNKGMKGISQGGIETQFKKGHKPANYKPVGSERVDSDGYIVIKVSDTGKWHERWKHKQRVVWEAEHGKIPKGHAITFLDGDKKNCALENLRMISRSTLAMMNRHKLYSDDPKATEVGVNVAKIYEKIGKIKREQKKKHSR